MGKKAKTSWFCQSCGAESPKWVGKCPSCSAWNSFVEETIVDTKASKSITSSIIQEEKNVPRLVNEISFKEEKRIDSNNQELNRVLGGGIVPGSMVLFGGEPGIGKSTLALQVSLSLKQLKILYVSGEESAQQIKLRADRIGIENSNCYILSETNIEKIFAQVKNIKPQVIVIDSIQTLETQVIESAPGSISQIRECTAQLLKLAKQANIPIFLIGHVTKDGNIAGPKLLEHMVDTVLSFEGDRHNMYRILRSIKNRFGSTSELGIFEMQNTGLREVSNPSELLLSEEDQGLSGTSVASSIEGARPFLIEIQALVSTAAYGTAQRSSTGFDLRRLNMLLAVLEKRAGFKILAKDVFLNIAGGLKVNDPAIDLAVTTSILSSGFDIAIPKHICFSGEIGLSGELRAVNRIEQRIGEAEKLGFKTIYVPKSSVKALDLSKYNIKIIPVSKVVEVYKSIFRNNS
ncbi:MAG: DNA repair protein RadA [Marinifilaceae bacterium]|jgi:DNA repair protein RadA/Sms|nr:DNA repair protein RadA [Marinifilaceae bacterium]